MKINFDFTKFKNFKNVNPKPEFKRSLTPNFKPLIITFVLGMVLILGVIYVVHPPFNWHSVHFYFYLVAIGVFLSCLLGVAYFNSVIGGNAYAKLQKLGISAILVTVAFMFISSFVASPFFIADQYYKRIDVQAVEFTEIDEVDLHASRALHPTLCKLELEQDHSSSIPLVGRWIPHHLQRIQLHYGITRQNPGTSRTFLDLQYTECSHDDYSLLPVGLSHPNQD